jgi:putative ABC transport system permease protein
MIKNYFKIAWRNLSKRKLHSFINIFGLSVGVAVCLLIIYFISYEKSWDKMHAKAGRIYRLNEVQDFPGTAMQKVSLTMYPMGPAIKDEYSQVENFTRLFPSSQKLISNGDKHLVFKKSFWVDQSFLDIFSFPLLAGNLDVALTQPNSAVITESSAKQIFGTVDVVGKTFLRDTIPFKVNAVLKDIPENSHLQFDALFSIVTIDGEEYSNNWGGNFLATYLLLKPGADPLEFEKQFPAFIAKHINPAFVKNYKLYLQPLQDVHLRSNDMTQDDWNSKVFSGRTVYVFIVLTIIILLIAFVNFINLSIAASSSRAKEVAIKKTIGASKWSIAFQFIGETIMLTTLAFTLGLLISVLGLPLLNQITDRSIQLEYFISPLNFFLFYVTAVLLGILAGLYPSFYIASFRTIRVLEGKAVEASKRFSLRNVLVTGQFTIAIILIIATLSVYNQVNYMRKQDPGFNKEQVIVLPVSVQAIQKKEALRNKLLGTAGVNDISYSGQRLGNNLGQGYVKFETPGTGIKDGNVSFLRTDERYIPLYQLKVIKGSNFQGAATTVEGQEYIINETLAKQLGWDDPVGKGFAQGGLNTPLGKITGVVKDFNFNSLKTRIEPLCISNLPLYNEISIRIIPGNVQQTLNNIKIAWDEIVKDRPFEYSFLDEHFAELYKTELQLSQVTSIAAGLSIFIASLGILGLISIIIQQRTKEIGIRKLLGASIANIIYIFSKRIILLVLIASIIAFPIAWWAMNKWLEDFAYRIHIGWWVFVVAGAAALMIALLTISFQAIKAAAANPVKSLRTE